MSKYIMAFDAGTTSSRCIIFNYVGGICEVAQKEFTQHYPKPGWVEHNADAIWSTQLSVAVEATTATEGKEILLTALKDPFFKIREKALQKLISYKLTPKELQIVEKVAETDSANLVKAAAIWVLAATKDKKYSTIFEKSLSIPSGAIKNAALNGIARTEPARAKNFLEQAKPEDYTVDELAGLASVIIDNKMEKYLPTMLPYFVYYPFLERDTPETSANFKKGYQWAMSLDNTQLVESIYNPLKDIAKEMENPVGKKMLLSVLDEGIAIKKGLTQTESLKKQIKLLEEIKTLFK